MAFNEDTRVKIPAILHLTRLGYKYVSLLNAKIETNTNIFTDIFAASLKRLNPSVEELNVQVVVDELKGLLDYEDLGREFYQRITQESGIKFIDFADFDNNDFHVVTELSCKNGDDEFRPDITVLINGLPLSFIEVKIPNNKGGIVAESARMNERRMPNKKFRRFLNATQLMVFSNNLEYDAEGGITPIQGAFYATVSRNNVALNSFREEDKAIFNRGKPIDEKVEENILRDNNLVSIKHSDEFATNKNIETPTNRILSSLFSRDRLKVILKYGFAYVKADGGGYDKHIMRYPQLFATLAIERHIEQGFKRGIIWHTQGSGKTALAYYNVPYLTDYFRDHHGGKYTKV
jgi:type I restriction enzyme R subunit